MRIGCGLRLLGAFAWQQCCACVFPILLFLVFALTKKWTPPNIYRYDLIFLLCLGLQMWMYLTRLETGDEVKVIAVFHGIGLALELYKTHLHCWSYPEPAWARIGPVPLYAGFMYAAVASYLCQAWRHLQVTLIHWPRAMLTVPLVSAIYLNFFTEHLWGDARWGLTLAILIVFRRTRVQFIVAGERFGLAQSIAFVLIGFFIWIAENIATRLGAWRYPGQETGWHLVPLSKISSWSMLVIITFIIVAQLKHVKASRAQVGPSDSMPRSQGMENSVEAYPVS